MDNYIKDLKLFTDIVLKNYPENMRPTCIDLDVKVEHLRELEHQLFDELLVDQTTLKHNPSISYPYRIPAHLEVRIFGMRFRFFPIQPRPEYTPSRRRGDFEF